MTQDKTAEALLPCPFCGCVVELVERTRRDEYCGIRTWYHIEGKHTGIGNVCPGEVRGRGSAETAIAAWNTRAAVRSQTAGEWLPIESAPKNGGVIRLFDPALYDSEFNFYFDGHHTDMGPDDQPCWMGPVWNACQDVWETIRINPTHWQPLPTPPAQGEASHD